MLRFTAGINLPEKERKVTALTEHAIFAAGYRELKPRRRHDETDENVTKQKV